MLPLYCTRFFLSLLFFCPLITSAQSSLLWKVSGARNQSPSYLFGTLHVICKEDLIYTSRFRKAFSQCTILTMENDFVSDSSKQDVHAQIIGPEGYVLKAAFDSADYNRLSRYFEDSMNMDLGRVQHLRPLALFVVLSRRVSPCTNPLSMERKLAKMGVAQGLSSAALEPVTNVLAGFSTADSTQVRLVMQLLDQTSAGKAMYNSLLQLYEQQDIAGLYQLSYNNNPNTDVAPRNKKWLPLMEAQMKKAPVFFAVGAAHLAGNTGLIQLLRQRGYKVEAVTE